MNKVACREKILDSYGIAPQDLLIIYDDLISRLESRLRRGDPAAIGSLLSHILSETQDFHRLRLGIGKPPPGVTVVDYVLHFSNRSGDVNKVIASACEAAAVWVKDGIDDMACSMGCI